MSRCTSLLLTAITTFTAHLANHGTIDDNAHDPAAVRHRYLRDALNAVLNGHPPPVAEAPSLGCGLRLRPPR